MSLVIRLSKKLHKTNHTNFFDSMTKRRPTQRELDAIQKTANERALRAANKLAKELGITPKLHKRPKQGKRL